MAGQAEILKWKWGGHVARLQTSRWTQISTMWDPAQAEGNKADQQANGWTPSGRLQECSGPELQEIEATGKLYRESCKEKTKTIMWTSSPHEL